MLRYSTNSRTVYYDNSAACHLEPSSMWAGGATPTTLEGYEWMDETVDNVSSLLEACLGDPAERPYLTSDQRKFLAGCLLRLEDALTGSNRAFEAARGEMIDLAKSLEEVDGDD